MTIPHIAFFDSGQGGLTVWESVIKCFPTLNTLYLGDNARCPYGNKSEDTITRYASEAALFLAGKGAELLVVACGTASSMSVPKLQKIFKLPIVGIVEGFCKVVAHMLDDKSRSVAVLATRFTIKSNRFSHELGMHGIAQVWQRACPLFVPLVEEGIQSGGLVDAACDMYLWDLPENVKIVMLACTHYPRIVRSLGESMERRLGRTVIYKSIAGEWILVRGSRVADDPIYIIDSSVFIVDFVDGFLNTHPLKDRLLSGYQKTYCTDSPQQFETVAKYFTSVTLPLVEAVEIQP
jgi:glutamate racemase